MTSVGTIVLNADYSVMGSVSWQRAVTLVVTGKAEIHEADPERHIRGATTWVPFPRIVRLVNWVYVKFGGRGAHGVICSKKGVLERDSYTCAYCGKHADTVDHVVPASRGGLNTWENLVSSCAKCNGDKADRTPEEARMQLKWSPWRPDPLGAEQRKVWASLK